MTVHTANVLLLVMTSAAAAVLFVRALLIFLGLYKDPILRTFENYGPQERPYLPGLGVIAWLAALGFLGAIWLVDVPSLSYALGLSSLLLAAIIPWAYNHYPRAVALHFRLLRWPRWYHELYERTDRYERRHIAYMWLRLPPRARLMYNSSDRAFFTWADFVILCNVRQEVYDPRQETELYTVVQP